MEEVVSTQNSGTAYSAGRDCQLPKPKRNRSFG